MGRGGHRRKTRGNREVLRMEMGDLAVGGSKRAQVHYPHRNSKGAYNGDGSAFRRRDERGTDGLPTEELNRCQNSATKTKCTAVKKRREILKVRVPHRELRGERGGVCTSLSHCDR